MRKIYCLFFLAMSVLSAQTITFPQDTIAYNDRFNNRQFAAYDSQGRLHVAYSGQLGTNSSTGELFYAEQTASGFTPQNITNNSVGDNYPTLSIDQNDKVHIGFTGRDASNLFQIKYTNNISGSFFEPIEITSGGLNKATPYSKVGPDSVVHFVYFTFTSGSDNIYYKNYDLRTSTISSERLIASGEAAGDFDCALDVDSQGFVHIALKAGSLFNGSLKYFNDRSGTLTEIPTGVTAVVSYPKIAVDHNDAVHILYRDDSPERLFITSYDNNQFTTPLVLTPPGQRPAGFQNIGVDDENRLYISYQSSVSSSEKGFFLVHGKDGAFSDTIKVYDLTSEYVTRNSSIVAAKGNGEISYLYAPGGIRSSEVICDIFMKQGNLFPVIPVELVFFNAVKYDDKILLNWTTATETNNYGFEIERALTPHYVTAPLSMTSKEDWELIGFVDGKGTSTDISRYSFNDHSFATESAGKLFYRLKQIDLDGSFEYSNVVEVDFTPSNLMLSQNYPNPFNPSTSIEYSIPQNGFVKLSLFDVLGKEIKIIVNEYQNAGNYKVDFNGNNLSSGIYFYKLFFENFSLTKKISLLK